MNAAWFRINAIVWGFAFVAWFWIGYILTWEPAFWVSLGSFLLAITCGWLGQED